MNVRRTLWVLSNLFLSTAILRDAQAQNPPTPSGAKSEGSSDTKERPSPPNPDPKEILRKADAAARKIKLVRYDAITKSLAEDGSVSSKIEGTAYLSGWSDEAPLRFRYEFKIQRGGKGEAVDVVVGRDGPTYYVTEGDTKTAFVGESARNLGTYAILVRFFPVVEFVHPQPFEEALTSETVEYRGLMKIEEIECHVVHAAYASGAQRATWYFSTKDYLPRAVERTMIGPDGQKSKLRTDLTNLVVNPTFTDEPLRFKLPEGFRREDKSAP